MGLANLCLRIRRVFQHVPQRHDVVGLRRDSSARTPCPAESAGRNFSAPTRTAIDSARSLRPSIRASRRCREMSRRPCRCRAAARAAVPDPLDRVQAFPERDFAPASLRDELLVGSAGIALEHGLGAQARAHILQSAAGARHELMIQALIARAAERAREICLARASGCRTARAAGCGTRCCRRYYRGRSRGTDPTRRASIPEYMKGPAFAGPRRSE